MIPDKFTATDPVSGESYRVQSFGPQPQHPANDGFRVWFGASSGWSSYQGSFIRALVEYGRELERGGDAD